MAVATANLNPRFVPERVAAQGPACDAGLVEAKVCAE